MHPIVPIAALPLLPTWLYLNRGYTIWFHLMTVAFLLTRRTFLRRFLIFQGTCITAGWYASILLDLVKNARFFHILYQNTPELMKSVIIDESGEVVYTAGSVGLMALTHAADTFAHPGLVYLLWRWHRLSGGTISDILTWSVVVSHYLFSRLWSVVHVYHNTGQLGFFYIGHDVYNVEDLCCWIPAYVTEGLIHAAVVVWILGQRPSTK